MISLSSDDGGCDQCILTSSMCTALGEAIRREHGQPEADAGVWAGMWIDGVLPGIILSGLEICPRVVVDLFSDIEPVWRYDPEVILVPLGDEVICDDEESRTPYPRRRRSPPRRGREGDTLVDIPPRVQPWDCSAGTVVTSLPRRQWPSSEYSGWCARRWCLTEVVNATRWNDIDQSNSTTTMMQ